MRNTATRGWLQRALLSSTLFIGTGGCNAILGIERAEVDESIPPDITGLACDNPSVEPKSDCAEGRDETTSKSCKIDECLLDKDCRYALFHYRRCARTDCVDEDGSCSECYGTSTAAKEVFACLDQNHRRIAGAISLCESYCKCMALQCSNYVGSEDACKRACVGGDPYYGTAGYFTNPLPDWKVYCLWAHCEIGEANDTIHCPHAIGQIERCAEEPSNEETGEVCGYPKSLKNGPCNSDLQCCVSCDPNLHRCN